MTNRDSHGPSLRPVKWLLGGFAALFLLLGLTTTRAAESEQPLRRPAGVGTDEYDVAVLQADSAMTDQMSIPGVDTGRQNHLNDDQLVRSQDDQYVRALEQYRDAIDRMLAREMP